MVDAAVGRHHSLKTAQALAIMYRLQGTGSNPVLTTKINLDISKLYCTFVLKIDIK